MKRQVKKRQLCGLTSGLMAINASEYITSMFLSDSGASAWMRELWLDHYFSNRYIYSTLTDMGRNGRRGTKAEWVLSEALVRSASVWPSS